MWVIVLEAMLALAMLLFIVWWTMFQGRGTSRPAAAHPAPPGSSAPDPNATPPAEPPPPPAP
jgi:hypothetical protein